MPRLRRWISIPTPLAPLPGCASGFPTHDCLQQRSERGDRASRGGSPERSRELLFVLVNAATTPDTARDEGDPAERRSPSQLPTSFDLEDEAVERLQRAGRTILRDSPARAACLEDLEA